jgi:hypothetical protein
MGTRALPFLGVLLGAAVAARLLAASDFDVVLSEINYHPFTHDDQDEFVEIYNRGPTTVELGGWSFSEGITFTFAKGSRIGPHRFLVLSPSVDHTRAHFGITNVVGPYTGKLNNNGEILTLLNARGAVISRVHYGNAEPWPSHPDGLGPTLELAELEQEDLPQNWSSSLVLEGTPGRQNSRAGPGSRPQASVILNEVGSSTGARDGFVEIFNVTQSPVDVSGYTIVDSRGARYRVPAGTSVAANGLLSLNEVQLGFPPTLAGASYALLLPDGVTWVDGMNPSSGPPGASFGSFPDGDGDQFVMTTPTPGSPNHLVLETSVIVNEILYHPPFVATTPTCLRQCSDPDQWIELYNRGTGLVDLSGWSLTKAVDFAIPAGTGIAAGNYLVIAADRARFLARYPAVNPAKVIGGWTGSLGRGSDSINLRDGLGNRVDHVEYDDGSPSNDESPADGVDDRTIASSEWPTGPDTGTGRTLELIHPGLDNRAGAAWGVGPVGGTPAAQNSVFDSTPPPVAWDVENSPVVPRSTDPVQVVCKASSVSPIVKVEILWHLDPSGTVNTVALKDDGLSGDHAAGDGTFGGSIPPQANRSIVAFQVRVQAQDGQTVVVPRSPAVAPYTGFKGPYYLYQVDSTVPPSNGSATYRVVITAADLNNLATRGVTSNVLLPCTFIGDDKAFHTVGFRYRGEHSRDVTPKPYRVDLTPEHKFHGLEHLNLDSVTVENELMTSDLFRRAGSPYMQEWPVNLIVNGTIDAKYIYKEDLNGDFLNRYFGGSSQGNLYRAIDPPGTPQGDLSYVGADPASYYDIYDKKSNIEEHDYSDIIELCRAFDRVQTPDAQFVARLNSLIDANEWARFFAIEGAVSNNDGAIETNVGEDYLLYKVPAGSPRPDAGKWLIIPWDIEETFTNATERLFRPDVAAIKRFLSNPAFAPLYYANVLDLKDGVFSREEMRKSFYLVQTVFGLSTTAAFESYTVARDSFFTENIPESLTAGMAAGAAVKVIKAGDVWKYFKGKSEPSGGNRSWTNRTGFDETPWLSGPTGIGYGDGDDATVLSDMINTYTTVYCRKAFTVADPTQVSSLVLSVDYDDGFVAYLNGQEVTRRNAPGLAGSFVAFNATAPAGHEASGGQSGNPVEEIDLSASRNLLVAGTNVLAIQVLNQTIGSSDLSMIPELLKGGPVSGAGCGAILYATASPVTLSGQANAGSTRSVMVNGAAADYDPLTAEWTAVVNVVAGGNPVKVEAFDGAGISREVLQLTVIRLAGPFTPVAGTLSAGGAWTAAGGPYLMNQNVVVPAGTSLTIGPGTVVIGQAGVSLIARGTLAAAGTADQPILFRAYSCLNPMGGIVCDSTGTSSGSPEHHLQFVDLEFGSAATGFLGTVSVVSSKVLLEDSTIRDSTGTAVDVASSRLEVRRSLVDGAQKGLHGTRSVVILSQCSFSRVSGASPAVSFDLDGPGGERSRVEGCHFQDGLDGGLEVKTASADIRNNVFSSFEGAALSVAGIGTVGAPTVTGNVVQGSFTGLVVKDGLTLNAGDHNTIVGNQLGISLLADGGSADGGHAAFNSLIVWDNNADVKADTRSSVTFSDSDLGELWPGTGNISAEPFFADESRGDFSLLAGSPAIQTGKDGSDMGAVPFSGPPVLFIRGDADSSGEVDLTDAIDGLEYLFRGRAGPSCLDRLDANDDGAVDLSDALYILFYRFAGGPPPPAPFPDAGADPTADPLLCR